MLELQDGRGAQLLSRLARAERLTPSAAEQVEKVVSDTGDRLCAVLVKLGLCSESVLADLLVEQTGFRRIEQSIFPSSALDLPQISVRFLNEEQIVPISSDGLTLTLAQWDAIDDDCVAAMAFATRMKVERVIATRSEIESALQTLYPDAAVTDAAAAPIADEEDDDLDRLKDLASDAPVIRLVQKIINDAVTRGASDIHLEPVDAALRVRFRIDGILHDVESQPAGFRAPLVSRIKIMAKLNIAERRLPQDGRIQVTVQGKVTDFRVSTAPTVHGESVVMRILDRQDIALDFAQLGFDAGLQEQMRAALRSPYGIILSTGPTGSGKTTTLYTALAELNTPERKILTVEDPIEYMLEGINQTQVKPQIGYSFASALRAFLRQDPDVLMVGEIRDRETAEVAIQAALTGHLLLSTLHTNSAAAAITRLLDMGVDDFLLSSTVELVIGQRLVRKLCLHCRQPHELPNVGPCFRAPGCAACGHTGYAGRTGILELLKLTEPLKRLVLQRVDAATLEKAAVEEGMRTMLQDGLAKARAGVTTVEEVLRVTRSV